MTHLNATEFVNADGSINTTRAMHAGRDARTDALRDMIAWVQRAAKEGVRFASEFIRKQVALTL